MIEVVWVRVPDVPVTVTVKVPKLAVPLAVKLRVLVVEVDETLGELNEAVTPPGRTDETDKPTV